MKEPRIILNRILTVDGTILTSHHRHDCQSHTDAITGGTYMVDGGVDYLGRSLTPDAVELSVFSDALFEDVRLAHHRGTRGKDGKGELKWVQLCDMSDEWLVSVIEYNGYQYLEGKISVEDIEFYNGLYQQELDYREENNITVTD